ncbi:MAG: AAA family ATPase, partial [Candidatus Magnetomorum sp.]|nr:AAA family ATPase [Candidatus Magnetomorum sp.]
MPPKRIKLPYGISNFKRLVRDGYYYVDKTKYIQQIEDS